MKLLLLPVVFVSLTSLLNAASSSTNREGQVHLSAQQNQVFKKNMLDGFHRIMALVVDNWNEVGKSVNKVADNIDNALDSEGNYPGKPWPIALSSLLLENVNVQLRSMIVQIAEGLLRINEKKGEDHGTPQGPPPDSSSRPEEESSEEGSGSESGDSPPTPRHFTGGRGGPGSEGHGEFDLSKLASIFAQASDPGSGEQEKAFEIAKLFSLLANGEKGGHGGQHHGHGGAGNFDISILKSMLSNVIAAKGEPQEGGGSGSGKGLDFSQLADVLSGQIGGGKNEHENEDD